MSERRQQRYAGLIKKELGKILFDFLEVESGILVTVTRISISKDLFHATVWFSVYPASKADDIMKRIQRSIYEIQQLFNKKMRVRPVPKLRFQFDEKPELASRVEKLLEKVKKEPE